MVPGALDLLKQSMDNNMGIIQPDVLVSLKHSALPLKRIFGVLKDVLTDVNIEFGNTCLIEGLDPEKVMAVRLHLMHLQEFFAAEAPIRIGVYLSYLHKLLRGVTASHVIEMTIHRSTPNILEVTVVHPDKNTRSLTCIKSIEIPPQTISIPPMSPQTAAVVLSTKDLQKAVREISLLTKRVCFGYTEDNITLVGSGNLGVSTITIGPSTGGLQWIQKSEPPSQSCHAFYFAKYLEKILRPDMSELVDVYITKDSPLVLQFSDKDYLGVFEFALAEIGEPA